MVFALHCSIVTSGTSHMFEWRGDITNLNQGDIMALVVDVSAGEFLDKMTILEIKSERIQGEEKLRNVRKELGILQSTWGESPLSRIDVSTQMEGLKRVNESLWEIEDSIRLKEAANAFDDEFVQLARSVYKINDRRAEIKREINQLLGSELMEEKYYPDYTPPDSLSE